MAAPAATVPAKIVMKGTGTVSLHERWSSLPAPLAIAENGVAAGTEPSIVRPTSFDDVVAQAQSTLPMGSMYADYEQVPAEYSLNGLSRPLDNRSLARAMAYRPNVRAAFFDDLAQTQVDTWPHYNYAPSYSRSPWSRLGYYRRPYGIVKRRPYYSGFYGGYYGGWRGGYYGAKRRGMGWRRRGLYSDSMGGGGRWRSSFPYGGRSFRGRGGFRGAFRGRRQQPRFTKEQLDSQLDEYMKNTKTSLDVALDSYMNNT